MINPAVAGLRVKALKALREFGPLKFKELSKILCVRNDRRLDNVLQDLRKSGQIHYISHKVGWVTGRGGIFVSNVRPIWVAEVLR